MHEDDRLLKIREAADRLGVDYGTIRGAIEQGLLPAIREGEAFRIRPEDLLAYRDRLAARPETKVRPPAPEAPDSPELAQARAFAERARRWARRPAGGDSPKDRGEAGKP